MIKTTVIGSMPVSLDGSKYAQSFFSKKILDARDEALYQAVKSQVDAGIDIVGDGQTGGHFVNIFAKGFKGAVIEEKPIIIDELEYVRSQTVEAQVKVREILPDNVQLKGIVTGAFTMAKSSENRFYKDTKDLAFAYVKGLAKEVGELSKIVDYIQVDEPYFSVDYPDYAKDLIFEIFKKSSVPKMLHICGDVSHIFKDLIEFKVDYLEHEFALTPQIWDSVEELDFKQVLGVGVLKSDNEKIESVAEITKRMNVAVKKRDIDKIMFNPDCGLRNMSCETAFQKLKNMVLARDGLGI